MLKTITIFLLWSAFSSLFAFEDIGVSPLFIYGEWDQIKSYKNLTLSEDGFHLDLDQYKKGHAIQIKRRIGAMAGFVGRITSNLLNNSPISDIGLAPVFKSNSTFITTVKDLEQDVKFRLIPFSENEIDQYRIGDTAYLDLEGGVAIHLGAQYGVIHAGGKYLIAGGFSVMVKKISDEEIYVELRKLRETGKSIYLNAIFPYLEIGDLKNINHGFSYLINYKSQAGLEAYGKILLGRLDMITANENVRIINFLSANRNTTFKGMGVGVPFIPIINFSRTKENTSSDELILDQENKETRTHYALSLKKRDMSFFGLQKTVDTAFLIKKNAEQTEMQMFFRHITNFSRSEKLSQTRDSLIELTGLKDFLDFSIDENEKLKYTEIEFAVNFGDKIVETLKHNRQKIVSLLKRQKSFYAEDNFHMKQMIKNLEEKDYKLTKAASFGQKLWESKTLFQFQLDLIKKCGGDISYEVSGKRISRLLRFKHFTETSDCPLN